MLRLICVFFALLISTNLSAGVLSKTEIAVFLDLTTKSIFKNKKKVLEKWGGPVRMKVVGNPKQGDIQELKKVICDINSTVGREVISEGQFRPNFIIYFTTAEQFREIYPMSQISTKTCMFYHHDKNNDLDMAKLYIDDYLLADSRKAAIRSGVTRSLGFTGISNAMKHSSFYEKLSAYVPEYSDLEDRMIQIMFHDEVKSGMTRKELKTVLKSLDSLENKKGPSQKHETHLSSEKDRTWEAPRLPKDYHLFFNGKYDGPYNIVHIQKMLTAGRITPATLAWKNGTLAEWRPVGEVLDDPSASLVYYLRFNGKQNGPYSIVHIQKMLTAELIAPDILAWKNGTKLEWNPVREVIADASASTHYHIFFNDKQEGPYDIIHIQEMLAAGRITSDALVWKDGTPLQWRPVIEVIDDASSSLGGRR